MICDSVVIENAKENVMPLKEGRYLDDLAQTLRKPKEVLQTRKAEYEAELKGLKNNTDLESFMNKWEEYIEWIKESYPTDSSLDILIPAYENCIQELTRLSDDNVSLMELSESLTTLKFFTDYVRKYLPHKVFLANTHSISIKAELRNPEEQCEVFEFMENRNICVNLPEFYEAAALAYACNKQYNRAFDVLSRGVSRLGSVVEGIYQRFAHKMEGKVADEKMEQAEIEERRGQRKAFTELNREELKFGFRVASQQRSQSYFPQKMSTTPFKIKPILVAPEPLPEICEAKQSENDEDIGEEPHKKKLRLIQSKIPEIRKGRTENIPTSERWSRVKIPQISIPYKSSTRSRQEINIYKDSNQEYRNEEGEITAYPKSILVSQTGEEQQFEEARMVKYLSLLNIKDEESPNDNCLENVSKVPPTPENADAYSSNLLTKTELLERGNECPRIQIGKSGDDINEGKERSEVSLETISDFICKQESSTGNAKIATLYFLDEMLSCLISLQENKIIHGSVSTKSFTYTTTFEGNTVYERNKTLSRTFWCDRGLKIHSFGPRSIDTKTLCGRSCCGAWPSHLKRLQERESWLWDIDVAGVYDATCKMMGTSTEKHNNQQNGTNANRKKFDVLSELWNLKCGDCCIESLKKFRDKVEQALFGDRRKVAATKAALVWIELNLFLTD